MAHLNSPGKPFSILVLCTGNICRSPVAEAILARLLSERPEVEVHSAGLAAPLGVRPDPLAVQTAATLGYIVSADKRSCAVSLPLLKGADLILVMEKVHKQEVARRMAIATGKTFLLGHWQNREIADPIGRSAQFHADIADQLELACRSWTEQIGKL